MGGPAFLPACSLPASLPHDTHTRPSKQVSPDMGVPAFLAAAEPLTGPLDAFFGKVFVMCEAEVRAGRSWPCLA